MSKPFSLYDKRNYSTVDVLTGYTKWSSTYDETVDSELDISLLTNLKTVPWSKVNKVLDLALFCHFCERIKSG